MKKIGANGIEKKLLINNEDYRKSSFVVESNTKHNNQALKKLACRFKNMNSEKEFFLSLINHLEYAIFQKFTEKFSSKEQREIIVKKNLMKRCSNQILYDKYIIGCTDLALIVTDTLRTIGYYCELIFTVSEYFSENNNQGHTLIYAEKKGKPYLIDASIKCVYEDYYFQKEFYINSIDGNLLIIGRTDIPNRIGLSNKAELTELRKLYFFNHKFFRHGFISQKRAKIEIG